MEQGEYTDWETWDYFDSDREGEVLDWYNGRCVI